MYIIYIRNTLISVNKLTRIKNEGTLSAYCFWSAFKGNGIPLEIYGNPLELFGILVGKYIFSLDS